MPNIATETVIAASPERVWSVLAAFNHYAEWNPLNIAADGEARIGARVRMTFLNLASAKPGATIQDTVTVVAAEPGRELAWASHVPLLFKGRHGFVLTPRDGATHVLHTEVLSGLIASRWNQARIATDFLPHYEAVNRALTTRVMALA